MTEDVFYKLSVLLIVFIKFRMHNDLVLQFDLHLFIFQGLFVLQPDPAISARFDREDKRQR